MRDVVAGFARELAAVRDPRPHPTVLLVGEIYVRSDPASNGWAADELEKRGLRVRIEPVVEYLQYSDLVQLRRGVQKGWKAKLKTAHPPAHRGEPPARRRGRHGLAAPRAHPRGGRGAARSTCAPISSTRRCSPWGSPRTAGATGSLDGVLCVGPLECMPNKLVEAQLVHAGRNEGLVSLTLSLNGDPIDPEVLDAVRLRGEAALPRAARRRRGVGPPPLRPDRRGRAPRARPGGRRRGRSRRAARASRRAPGTRWPAGRSAGRPAAGCASP